MNAKTDTEAGTEPEPDPVPGAPGRRFEPTCGR